MIFYSHWLDFVGKLVSLIILIVLLFGEPLQAIVWASFIQQTPNPEFFRFMIVLAIGATFFFLFHHPVIDVLITKLYVRQRFGVSASWQQAKALRRLFCISYRTLEWKPMTHVRALPLDQRLGTLLDAATE